MRGLTSESEAKALYTSGRGEVQGKIKAALSEALGRRGIVVEDVLLKAVKLPDTVSSAIELKAQAEQDAQRMESAESGTGNDRGSMVHVCSSKL